MSTLKVQAICPKCRTWCGIKYAKGGDGKPLLAQHSAPARYGRIRCDAAGTDATAGIAGWIERHRERAQATVDHAPERVRAAEEEHAKKLAEIEAVRAEAQATLDALAKFTAKLEKSAKGGAK